MAASGVVEDLAGLSLFTGCGPSELAAPASMLSPVDEPSGAVLARQGEPARSFLLVTRGEAAVLRDDGRSEEHTSELRHNA